MTKTYAQIVKQIETLKDEADKLRRKEVEGVIGRIREAITVYGLTAADLGLTVATKAPKAPKAPSTTKKRGGRKAAKGAAAAKYRNEAGQTWVGRGKRPQWLRDALAGGKTLADFEIK